MRPKSKVCVHSFTYYGACIFILDVDLPEQPALIVLIHDAWWKKKIHQQNFKTHGGHFGVHMSEQETQESQSNELLESDDCVRRKPHHQIFIAAIDFYCSLLTATKTAVWHLI